MPPKGDIKIFQPEDGEPAIEVKLEKETVWLSLNQLATLFGRDKSSISRHIKNIYDSGELDKAATVANFATVQKEGGRAVSREVTHYNLDLIISVGYRVNSKRGTQFRIWANKVLKDYLVKGYAVDKKRLEQENERLRELNQVVQMVEQAQQDKALTSEETTGLLQVVTHYAHGLEILDQYDYEQLQITRTSEAETYRLTYEEARKAIDELRGEWQAPDIFGQEKDDSFHSSLQTIYQTYDGKDLYPSIEEKAAQLLYLVIKNHSFVDGNKRIAASLFLWFLQKNGLLYRSDGTKRIPDNALVALTLMIAESDPAKKDVMTKVVVNLINQANQ